MITRQVTHGLLNLGYRCRPHQACRVSFGLVVPRALAVTVHWAIGQIRLHGLTGPVWARAGIGQIQASAVSGPLIRLYTGTGTISAGCTASPRLLVARSGVGAVTLRVPVTVPYRVIAKSQVGTVRVTVPQTTAPGRLIDASTGDGTVLVTGN